MEVWEDVNSKSTPLFIHFVCRANVKRSMLRRTQYYVVSTFPQSFALPAFYLSLSLIDSQWTRGGQHFCLLLRDIE